MAGQVRRTVPEVTLLDRALSGVGQFWRDAAPTLTTVQQNGAARVAANLDKGEYARAAGNVVSNAAALPAALAMDAVGAPVASALRGTGHFLAGVLGMDAAPPTLAAPAAVPGAVKVNADGTLSRTRGTPSIVPVEARDAVNSAMAQGRAAPALSAQDALGAYITNVLQGGATIREAKQLGELVPAVVKQGTTAKNTVLGETAALSQSIYQQQIAGAQELAKTDPAGAKAVVAKATDAYFARNAGLVGFDPSKLVEAELMGRNGDE